MTFDPRRPLFEQAMDIVAEHIEDNKLAKIETDGEVPGDIAEFCATAYDPATRLAAVTAHYLNNKQ